MSRDNNNSDRPKRPRISTKKSSDDSRASRSGNSSGSKPFKKPFSKDGGKKGRNIKDPTQDLKRNLSKEIPTVSKIPMMILVQNLKENLISRTKVRAMRRNLWKA
ncbi:hypothetical protein OWR28_12240 [Chryseobacterium sp. 1B4]